MTPSPLILLGMHRSGTSALMRVLNLLGVEIGSHLLPKHHTNETGFWEWFPMVQAHETIFQLLHSTWFNPLPLPPQWWQSESLTALQVQMKQVLHHQFANSPLWGMKDPRLCRLLPFWLPILDSLGMSPKFVIIARPPEEVAASLKRRDDFFLHETALWLWLTYMLEAEQYSQPYARVWVTYDELLTDWQATVTKIASVLTLKWPHTPTSVQSQVQDFLTPNLRHHHTEECPKQGREEMLLSWSQSVYSVICEAAQGRCEGLQSVGEIRHAVEAFAIRRPRFYLADKSYQIYLERHCSDVLSFLYPPLPPRTRGGVISLREEVIPPVHRELGGYRNGKTSPVLNQPPLPCLAQPLPTFHLFIVQRPGQSVFYLNATLASLHNQTYPHWQVHLSFPTLPTEGEAGGEWVAVLHAGDTLAPELLWWCVLYIHRYPQWWLLYTDEDLWSPQGEHYAPQFKPDWNLDLLRSTPYIGGFVLVQREALQQVGGYANYPLLENVDLALKLWERYGESTLGHVPYVLYHRATVNALEYWPATTESAIAILQQHCKRQAISAQVYETDFFNLYCIEYSLEKTPLVSLILTTRNDPQSLQRCLHSLLTVSTYPHYEVIVVDNHSTTEEMRTYLMGLMKHEKIQVLFSKQERNVSQLLNLAVAHAQGSILCFLNDDSQIIQPSGLQELLSHCLRPEVGAVGPRLLGADHRLLHSGLILGMGVAGVAGRVHHGLGHDELGYLGRNQVAQNFSAISDTGLMIEKSLYLEVGGMEETFNLFNEVEFCLKITATGKKMVWTPFATLLQHGPGSVIRYRDNSLNNQQFETEVERLQTRWMSHLREDPAYHPHLSLHGSEWQPDSQITVPWNPHFQDRPRVVAFPYDSWGCGEYRVRAPLRALQRASMIEYALMPNDKEGRIPTPTELARLQPDTVLLHNTLQDEALQRLKQYQEVVPGFKIFGQDDLLFALPKANPYRRLNYRDLKPRIGKAISHCDRLLVTTEPLAEIYQYVASDIRIVPNYLERHRWDFLTSHRRQGRQPRVGWAGAAQHQGDLQLIIPLVITLASKEEVEWVFFGMCPEELRPYVSEYHPMVPFDEYPAKLASLNLDVAIAPLEIHPFNEAKSHLRLLEYGILGWPVICSDIYPYQSAPVTRVPNTSQAWLQAVREHIYDLEAAQQAGEELRQWVKKYWLLEDHLDEWAEALNVSSRRLKTSSLGGNSVVSSEPSVIFLLGNDFTSCHFLESILTQHSSIVSVSEADFFAEVHAKLNMRSPAEASTSGCCSPAEASTSGCCSPAEASTPVSPHFRYIVELWTEWEEEFRYVADSGLSHRADLLKRRWAKVLDYSPTRFVIYSAAVSMAKTQWLQQHFPNAYFIHIVRNGYAVALELRDRIQQQYGVQPLLLSRTARHWARSLEILQEDMGCLKRFLEIRYEEIITDPSAVFQQIAGFLQLPELHFSPSLHGASQKLDRLNQMTAAQRAVIEREAGKRLECRNIFQTCTIYAGAQ